ncbi:MerR HTH family regulatory protein [Rathayibacter oskolensis]|uniref:MerR HTH family regulatory protein n=1 Tax=Rathayibacter oskolensis TaxID=1891671 RepID=A0A1X7PCP3_9MICO|nr:MerR family transcriptional regulator [Rathayibacter oskolensis]SMH48828.1 MerR HTH family regulatory protein [Rathayibacter oskolensis]
MKISELSAASGVPIATLKFYLREGMLERGVVTSPTRAEYGQEHLDRVRLIQALTAVRELPIARVREILAIVDGPLEDPVVALGQAVAALPPYLADASAHDRARAAADLLGFVFDPEYPATAQLEWALEGLERAGLEWNEGIARRYWEALLPLAEAEVAPIGDMTGQEAVTYAVLGTALYEPVILALRRLAHRRVAQTDAD